jgi:hypothetical protein
MPVSAIGRIIFGAGVSADGILWASAVSIWVRIVEAVGISVYSLYIRLCLPVGANRIALKVVQDSSVSDC